MATLGSGKRGASFTPVNVCQFDIAGMWQLSEAVKEMRVSPPVNVCQFDIAGMWQLSEAVKEMRVSLPVNVCQFSIA